MEEEIKYRKKILIAWIGAIVVTVLLGGIVLCSNVLQRRAEAKERAMQTLRGVAERIVNQEFDKLKMNHVSWADGESKYTKRKSISDAGEFEIEVDSLKETQGLYSLDMVGMKAGILNEKGKFPLEQILVEWKDEMDARYSGALYALSLKVHPLGSDSSQELFVGDKMSVTSCDDLGTYYLDEMYTMRLTAYTAFGFWCCVDWTDSLLWVFPGIFFVLVLAGGGFYVIRFREYEKKENLEDVSIVYRFGECVFDSINHTLTYRDTTMSCTPQSAKLLLGFAKSPDFFLTNDEINAICDWRSDDLGINERRRTAISALKRLFAVDKSVEFRFVKEKSGYKITISKKL